MNTLLIAEFQGKYKQVKISIPALPPPPGLGGEVGEPPGVDPPGVGPLGVDALGVGPAVVEPSGVEGASVPGAPPLPLIMSAMWSLYTLPSMTFC